MNTPAKSCPACGNNLSLAQDVKPGVCPNCGRRMVLRRKYPLDWSECSWAAFTCCVLVLLSVWFFQKEVGTGFSVLVVLVGAPNFWLGFFTAGLFSRTVWAQLLWGVLLGVVFGAGSWGLIYVGARRLSLP